MKSAHDVWVVDCCIWIKSRGDGYRGVRTASSSIHEWDHDLLELGIVAGRASEDIGIYKNTPNVWS